MYKAISYHGTPHDILLLLFSHQFDGENSIAYNDYDKQEQLLINTTIKIGNCHEIIIVRLLDVGISMVILAYQEFMLCDGIPFYTLGKKIEFHVPRYVPYFPHDLINLLRLVVLRKLVNVVDKHCIWRTISTGISLTFLIVGNVIFPSQYSIT